MVAVMAAEVIMVGVMAAVTLAAISEGAISVDTEAVRGSRSRTVAFTAIPSATTAA